MIVTERLYLTADRKKVVKEGDPKAAFLLAAPKQELPDIVARQYGLLDEEKKQGKKAKNKMAPRPEDKAAGALEDKQAGKIWPPESKRS